MKARASLSPTRRVLGVTMRYAVIAALSIGLAVACKDDGVEAEGTVDTGGHGDTGSGDGTAAPNDTGSGSTTGDDTSTTVVGSGESSTAEIGPEGGVLGVGGVTLTIPPGALAETTQITVTELAVASVPGYTPYSPVYRFEPAGLELALPATLSVDFKGDATLASLFWSRVQATGYERLGGLVSGTKITEEVSHFSDGFVADGVSYADPPDASCVVTRLVEGRTLQPASVALFFTVDDCQGRPITGLSDEKFELAEDGKGVSSETKWKVLKGNGLQVFVTLVLDLSSSSQEALPQIVDGAKALVQKLQIDKALPAQIAIEVFAGDKQTTVWQKATLDPALLAERLDDLWDYAPSDPDSTNLNGALVQALGRVRKAQDDFRARNHGGAFTTGYVVLFTDGGDTSGIVDVSEAVAAVEAGAEQVVGVGVDGLDFDQAALKVLAPNGVVKASNVSSVKTAFEDLGNRIAGQVSRTYLLGYCSPKRKNDHTVTVTVKGAESQGMAAYTFSADGFGNGCSLAFFDQVCEGKQCGGLGCGACSDWTSECVESSGQCVSFCVSQNKCGGEEFINPSGYAQKCAAGPGNTDCGGTCRDLTSDAKNC